MKPLTPDEDSSNETRSLYPTPTLILPPPNPRENRNSTLSRSAGTSLMAWVPASLAKDGERIVISDEDKRMEGEVQTRPFYDPDGEILRS